MNCHFSFAFLQNCSRQNQYLKWKVFYSSMHLPRTGGNPKVNINLSDSETRYVSHQLGKFCAGCHPDFVGVVLNQAQLHSIWLCSPAWSYVTEQEQGQLKSLHLQLGTGVAVAVCLALGSHLTDLHSQQAHQKYLGQKHLEKLEKLKQNRIKGATYIQSINVEFKVKEIKRLFKLLLSPHLVSKPSSK